LALRRVRGVGPRIAKLLIDRFETPERVFGATVEELASAGMPRQTARSIADFRDFEPLERELCEVTRIGARLVRLTDADYPPNLSHIPDPPPFLYVRGNGPIDSTRCVAVVGARAASDAGRRMAQRLGLELAAKGIVVVSGLARGIDAEAHQGALDARGHTIAVLGSGIDVIYPPEHRALAEKIVESEGALLTELPVATPPTAENFPTRNRILSGLCLGVVIVEAADKSGSLITARLALEQDRQVFAVPGSPVSGKARGSNRLIKQGAVLVECVEDVVEELAPQLEGFAGSARPGGSAGAGTPSEATMSPSEIGERPPKSDARFGAVEEGDARAIISKLNGEDKLHIDAIIEATGLNAQTVLQLLLELELRGLVSQHPGKLFSLA
jgi:DNA processing protein